MLAAVRRRGLDISGIGLSTLCLAHCLAMPLITGMLPVLATVEEAEWLHRALVAVAVPVTGRAWWHDTMKASTRRFQVLAPAGLALLIVAAFIPVDHQVETGMTVLGALGLAIAHALRWADHTRLG
mgnify:CR=1 FL=1